jgi:DNA repair protein RAD5
MDIYTTQIIIHQDSNEIIENCKLQSFNNDFVLFTISYNNNKSALYKHFLNTIFDKILFFEVINNKELWKYQYNLLDKNDPLLRKIQIQILLNNETVSKYINRSMALNMVIQKKYNFLPNFIKFDSNLSFIPNNLPIDNNILCKIDLYNYQKKSIAKMIEIENKNTIYKIDHTFKINIENNNYIFDPIQNIITDENKSCDIITNGGILADEMGLGKTMTTLGLIISNPNTYNEFYKYSNRDNFNKIYSKATLIICPSHLTKQWELEAHRINPLFNILVILTKKDHEKLLYKDFIDSDIIITSQQFLMNFKYYPTLYYTPTITPSMYNHEKRLQKVKLYYNENIINSTNDKIRDNKLPIFEFFNFNRLVLDEGHEIFGEMLGNQSLSRYMISWLSSIDANHYWYVSGSPFVNQAGLFNCLNFLGFKIINNDINYELDINKSTELFNIFIKKNYVWNNVLEKICIRNRKNDISEQLFIKGYDEFLEWIEFTDIERKIYESKVNKINNDDLLRLCCHPLVLESSKKIFGDSEVNLEIMETKLIEYHTNIIQKYEEKLNKLENTNQAYYMTKKSYENIISESKFMLNILNKLNDTNIIDNNENNENICSICMEQNDISLTKCGHIYCLDCIKNWLTIKKNCPICKKDLLLSEVYKVKNDVVKKPEFVNPLIQKYGSKLGKIISMVKSIIINDESRIIIFSQWDQMLSLIAKSLSENGIVNCSVKGNVWARNSAINKFRNGKNLCGDDNKVILLSLKNSASGTNLTEATHIFFVDPIDSDINIIKAVESQAIARACRIGQKHKIKLYRMLIKNSIDEYIYENKYRNKI